jgi:ankyrin repeat protein
VAAHNCHETVVRALIEMGADVNKADNAGMTPLQIAARRGHKAVVQALIDVFLKNKK